MASGVNPSPGAGVGGNTTERTDGTVSRKLAAILYADIAGYSRLTGEDEVGTHEQLFSALDVISANIGSAGGQAIRDGVFSLASDGVVAVSVDYEFDLVLSTSADRERAEGFARIMLALASLDDPGSLQIRSAGELLDRPSVLTGPAE